MTTPAGAVAGNARAAQDDAAKGERKPAGGGGFFSRKYGPLPGWGWAAVAGVGALAYFLWKRRSAQQAASASGATYTGGTGSGVSSDQLAALQDEIDALQGELSTQATTGPTTTGPQPTGPQPAKVTVPHVVGLEAGVGTRLLQSKGFKVDRPRLKAGVGHTITSESPVGGSKAPKGSTVALQIKAK